MNPNPVVSDVASGREALLAGDLAGAGDGLARIVAANPTDLEARYWLASARLAAGDPQGDAVLDEARTLHALLEAKGLGVDLVRCRTDAAYAGDMATRLYGHGLVAMSGVLRGQALANGAADAQSLVSYGLALQHQGRVEEASEVFRLAVANFGALPLRQMLAYAQLFCEDGERRHAHEARLWAQLYQRPPPAAHDNAPLGERRLRIGFVAPTFAKSQLRQFITPVFENLDAGKVEVVLYTADAASDTDWPSWIQVKPIGHLNDADAAALIRQDRIDILNDCWGHTVGSRLGVFVRKPAPVQVAWINFFQTTGLPQMDYVLHAAGDAPADADEIYTEARWPVGPVFTPFRAQSGRLPPAPTPARAEGRITFGSFSHPAKISPHALATWAAVLRGQPDARLLFKYRYFFDPVLQRVTRARLAAHGVEPERVVFEGHTEGADYFKAFQKIDMMLDCWPAPGSTTTLETLSNGVPVLAMIGERPNAGGVYAQSILRAVGLTDLVTHTPEQFVARALEQTSDLDDLDQLRARVRPGFDHGPISDEAGFARDLERAYVQMFERWSAGGSSVRRGL
jgi:protein O-GlcNAc transferase